MRMTAFILAIFMSAEAALLFDQAPEAVEEALAAAFTFQVPAEAASIEGAKLAAFGGPAIDMHPTYASTEPSVLVKEIKRQTTERVVKEQSVSYMLFFDHDNDALDPSSAAAIHAIAVRVRLNRDKTTRILITGHADKKGLRAYNRTLSERRAQAVRKALIGRGVPAGRIRLSGMGEMSPRIATPDGHPEPRNRRAVVTVGPTSTL